MRLRRLLFSSASVADVATNRSRYLQLRDIGLFRYYRPEQLPNFLLALPVLALTAAGVGAYVRADVRRVLTLGLTGQEQHTKPRELAALEQQVRADVALVCA